MTAYVIADVKLTGDADELAEYRSQVVATLAPYGGRYLARGGETDVVEGAWAPGQIVLVEFPDLASARAWNDSAEYQAIAPLRSRNTDSRRLIVEGL
ncbi:DUF1330 domain-containing protein [Streptomyces sp. NBC_00102]|uniref:DUF1330 domain-containing protein n=1 Tax=Streptomyces sp. NBC_00102 TaxID=2975652 RepID=UPI00224CAB64|nr:DUF1330 domain-containing protein [Streptomyces sp. NBC_00102]MCX5398936.1 DUF1330 domain-containing protein [Streptomyces sp. NBC_00102]